MQDKVPLRVYFCGQSIPAYKKGGLVEAARTAARGRNGDSKLIHVNEAELRYLEKMWGPPTINPETNLPEYFKMRDLLEIAAPVVSAVAPALLPEYVPQIFDSAGLNNLLASTVLGAGSGALLNGGKGALKTGALSAAGALAAPYLMNATGITDGAPTLFGALSEAAPAAESTMVANPEAMTEAVAEALTGSTPTGLTEVVGDIQPGGAAMFAETAGSSKGALSDFDKASGSDSWWSKYKPKLDKIKDPLMVGGALMALQGLNSPPKGPEAPNGAPVGRSSLLDAPADPMRMARQPIDQTGQDWYTFGTRAALPGDEGRFFTGNNSYVKAASGGALSHKAPIPARAGALSHVGAGAVGKKEPGGDGRSDGIPALLSNDEYVWDAETTALLGDGDADAGARKLDQMREIVRKEKGKNLARGKISRDAPGALELLKKAKVV